MADTYSQLFVHVVFAVKYREALIEDQWRNDLCRLITGCFIKRNQKLLAIKAMPDHMHMLISMTANSNLSEIVRDIKLVSNTYINSRKLTSRTFKWQEGFGAFSCGKSSIPQVARYIENQEKHHRSTNFTSEYESFIEKSGIERGRKMPFINPE